MSPTPQGPGYLCNLMPLPDLQLGDRLAWRVQCKLFVARPRSQEVHGHGCCVPEGTRAPVSNCYSDHLPLLVCWPVLAAHWAGGRCGCGGRAVRSWPAATAACFCPLLPDAEVPAGPEHCQPRGIYHTGGADLPHPCLMAGSVCARLRPPWCCTICYPILCLIWCPDVVTYSAVVDVVTLSFSWWVLVVFT